MEFAKTRSTEMDSQQGGTMGKSLPVCSYKICFKNAVSKEILTKRGLVSISDYYSLVHI